MPAAPTWRNGIYIRCASDMFTQRPSDVHGGSNIVQLLDRIFVRGALVRNGLAVLHVRLVAAGGGHALLALVDTGLSGQ